MPAEPRIPADPWTLVVLAAGLGTRFGGRKQLEPVGPSGQILSDYALRDACRAGAGACVFVIAQDDEGAYRSHHRDQAAGVPITFAHQRMDRLPPGHSPPDGRVKPWGTAHALLTALPLVSGPCVIVNADDFYGPTAFRSAHDFLQSTPPDRPAMALVGYRLADTTSPWGPVSRAVVLQRPDGMVEELIEVSEISACETGFTGVGNEVRLSFTGREIVSMNCWVLNAAIFPLLEEAFQRFLERGHELVTSEFRLPDALNELRHHEDVPIHVLPGGDGWMGLTHPGDRDEVRAALLEEERIPCS